MTFSIDKYLQKPDNISSRFTEQQFETLFKTHFLPLCNFARKYLDNIDDCKEIVHDVFINIWEKREQIDPEKSIKSYLYTSVNNRCLNFIRDHKKFVRNTEINDLMLNVYSSDTETTGEQELIQQVEKTLALLPEKCKEIFILNRYEGLKYQEIADKLNLSVKTVEAQISKGLRIFRDNLKDYMTFLILGFFLFFK